jgi:hypothetical protein
MNRWLLVLVPCSLLLSAVAFGFGVGGQTEASQDGGFTQGNIDCSAAIDGLDALYIAQYAAGITAADGGPQPAGGCPTLGSSMIGGYPWGDLTCSNGVTIDDAILPLMFKAGLPLAHYQDCVDVGQSIGGPTFTPSPTPFACNAHGWTVAAGSATWDCASSDTVELHVDDGEHILLRDDVFTDTHMEADVMTENREAALVIRAQDGQNAYVAVLIPDGTPFSRGVQFYKIVGGAYQILALQDFLPGDIVQTNEVAHFEVDMVGTHVTVKVNGATLIDINDGTYASGKVGLRAYADPVAPCDTVWDNIAFNEIP